MPAAFTPNKTSVRRLFRARAVAGELGRGFALQIRKATIRVSFAETLGVRSPFRASVKLIFNDVHPLDNFRFGSRAVGALCEKDLLLVEVC